MGRVLAERAADVFAQASAGAGRDLVALTTEADDETLRRTENAQLALYVCGVAAFSLFDGEAEIAAGHSVGEYAALAAAEIIDVEEGARLVAERGRLMAGAPAGGMTAILGMERDRLQDVIDGVGGVVAIANDNSPGQLVISGEKSAVAAAAERALKVGAKRALPLNVSGGFHSPLMTDAAEAFALTLAKTEFSAGLLPVVANVTADVVDAAKEWPGLLEAQLRSPVRWTESVERMIVLGVTEFVEFGGGEVLGGLIKRIDKTIPSRPFPKG